MQLKLPPPHCMLHLGLNNQCAASAHGVGESLQIKGEQTRLMSHQCLVDLITKSMLAHHDMILCATTATNTSSSTMPTH